MEEKNQEIISYINSKVKELEKMSMYIPRDNVEKLQNAFLNRGEDINLIKTRIDTIFNNSVNTYKENLEKVGNTYNKIIEVYNQIQKMNKTTAKLYLAGGIIPYVLLSEDSQRKHTNLDLLCSKDDIRMIREVFRKNKLYEPKRDSLTYTINDIDYGFQIVIDNVKVNISVFEEKEDHIIEYSFDCHNRIGRIKKVNVKLSEYILPYVSADNKKYRALSLELLTADKLLLNREKDQLDINKIKECNGMSEDKIKNILMPVVKEERLIGDNLEFTTTMPRIKLEIPNKKKSNGFVNFATILLIIGIVVCIILSK